MVILEIFSKNITVSYKSTFFSKATLLTLTFGVISVVVPFILAYKSKGFWVRRDVFYEQPNVKFKGEFVFFATTSNISHPLVACSSVPQYREKFSSLDTCSSIKVQEIDENFDSKVEELNLHLRVNLPKETHLTSISIVIPLDYKLSICPLQMQAAVIFQTFLFGPISEYIVMTDATITQSTPLVCHNKKINNLYNNSVIATDVEDITNNEIERIVTSYSKREMSTTIKNTYTSFSIGLKESFVLRLTVRYPEDKIYFKAGFWHTMKWAWVQYLAIYFVISWIVTKVNGYIFNKRLVLYYEENPLKKQ